jgi:predicted transcriptional regulator
MSAQLEHGTGGLLIYRNALLIVTVLGGVKLEGLDRMRVTLKVEIPDSPRPPVRHNLDLYNDNQLGKLVRVIAARLEVGMSVTEACLAELIEGLEAWRLEEVKKQGPEKQDPKPLTETEREQAEQFLKAPQLMERTSAALKASGLIGEEANGMILYVAMTSRQCEDPLSVICLARSGVGKSYLMERVALCMPEDSKLENTQFTENSFYYFRREEIRGRIFLIEDLDGAQAVLYPIRELQSKKRISKTVTVKDRSGAMRTISLVVEGPVSVIGCSTQEAIYEDNANRSLLVHLDDSPEQDARIMDYQRAARAGLTDRTQEQQVRKQLQDVQRVLRPIKVVNPYAPLIALPQEVFKPRRTLGLLLGFVEAITFYHQLQRPEKVDETSGEIYVETSPEDVEAAFGLLRDTLFRKSDELSGACRSLLEWIRANEKGSFTAQAIRKRLRMAPRTLSRHLAELTAYGYVTQDKKKKHSAGYLYTVASDQANDLPEVIAKQIAQVMEKVKAAAGSEVIKPAVKVTEAAPVKRRGPGRPRKVVAVEGEKVGQSATVGQTEVGQPTAVDHSELEQVGQSATETEERNEEVAAQ